MLSKSELTKQTVRNLFNKLNKITDQEEREFKQYWLLDGIISQYTENKCMNCKNSGNCWNEINAVYHADNIIQHCKHGAMAEAIKLKEQIPIKMMSAGNDNHKRWHDEVKEMLKESGEHDCKCGSLHL